MNNAVKIRFKLKGDTKHTICIVTRVQYENFKILPVLEECEIIQRNLEITGEQIDEVNQTLVDAIRKENDSEN